MADIDSRDGKSYSSREILDWVAGVHAPHDEALRAAFEAPEHEQLPAIQVGPSEGKLLTLLLRLVSARKVVEVGTLAGYSALRLCRALPAEGHLWSVESEPRHATVARRILGAAGLGGRVDVVEGYASDVLPSLEKHGPFCAVFIDADKERYDLYGRWAAKHVRPGGLLIADNAFLFGELLDASRRAEVMRAFHLEAREAFDTVCVPTPDGLLVGVKR